MKQFIQEDEKYYGDFSDVTSELETMFKYLKNYYPTYSIPTINTVVTGFRFNQDFSFSDSLIVISTDYFLGKKASYKPDLYAYMLSRYQKPYIVPMIGLALSSKYNEFDTKDESMLSNMIFYGKAHYFLERIMPDLADSLNIQYTDSNMMEVNKNADVIWAHFIDKKLLFDNNHKTIQRYVGESPKVAMIGDKCPGRIGRWLGWQIVRKYMKDHPEVTLQQLMADKDANKIFKESKFKVKKS
jgi:hypothetical protein